MIYVTQTIECLHYMLRLWNVDTRSEHVVCGASVLGGRARAGTRSPHQGQHARPRAAEDQYSAKPNHQASLTILSVLLQSSR